MSIWDEILEAASDVKVGFIVAIIFGYGLYRLTRSKKHEDDSRDDTSNCCNDEISEYNESKEEIKLVLVIRTDLKMGKGKIAAQCAHGAVAAYKSVLKQPKLLRAWENEGQKKIALKVVNFVSSALGPEASGDLMKFFLPKKQVDSDVALKELSRNAKAVGLLTNTIQDAGRTQIAAGSRTVCAIGPGPSSLIDQVTGHLKLF